ncbi:mRNA decay activator protein ZFP36L2 [Erinaceus europaeus]|uniref:mRNA decay activator protein ZFP36 n=1 Tax=Erinaceus europaeus TaxID=9365 RepID=A0A1S3AM10_ERIEU|nr:mRNA decay activator protein ZFP36L2 [Erinaceus europaeus]
MSTTLLSAFYDLDFLCKTEKSLAGLSLGSVLDSKAVGAPVAAAPSLLRRPAPPGPPCAPEPGGRRERALSEGGPPGAPARAPAHSPRYKTELCRPFEESGVCKYGDKCQFAHGGHELRSLARHPKYKTELCRTFHTAGFCPYGPRCHFIHNADERRPAPGGTGGAGPRPRLQHSLSFAGFPAGHRAPGLGGLPLPAPRGPGSPRLDVTPSPPDSPSDPESSLSSGSLSPSGSPGLDAGRRLPIFSRLSISDD